MTVLDWFLIFIAVAAMVVGAFLMGFDVGRYIEQRRGQ